MTDTIDPDAPIPGLDDVPTGPGRDNRPTYSPDQLIGDIIRLLGQAGIRTNLASEHVARMSARDLLVALGVRPVNVHELPRRGAAMNAVNGRGTVGRSAEGDHGAFTTH